LIKEYFDVNENLSNSLKEEFFTLMAQERISTLKATNHSKFIEYLKGDIDDIL
jgi:hypothetical protein